MTVLGQADIEHFLQHGFVRIPECFTREAAVHITQTLWTRLGVSSTDKATWSDPRLNLNAGRINMPSHSNFSARDFAPKAWSAICQLLGGEDQISEEHETWNDGWIVNFGTPELEGVDVRPQDLKGWHVDGDFFIHYLDSPEQGLLVIPMFTDIRAGGGGTYICPGALKHVAKYLYANPAGVSPRFVPRSDNALFGDKSSLQWFNQLAASMPDEAFVEMTGQVGDVVLMHPLMMHSASNNRLRDLRIITNPPVSIKEPFRLQRKDGEYTIVERKTLQELDLPRGIGDWKISAPRQRVIPERLKAQAKMKEQELQRLKDMNVETKQLSSHLISS